MILKLLTSNDRQRYSHSKQGSIRHAKELNDRYNSLGVTAYSLHPGVIKTNLQRRDPTLFGQVQKVMMKLTPTLSIEEGARNSLFCATSPEAPWKGQGRFFSPVGKMENHHEKWLIDSEGNKQLWEHSEAAMRKVE